MGLPLPHYSTIFTTVAERRHLPRTYTTHPGFGTVVSRWTQLNTVASCLPHPATTPHLRIPAYRPQHTTTPHHLPGPYDVVGLQHVLTRRCVVLHSALPPFPTTYGFGAIPATCLLLTGVIRVGLPLTLHATVRL